MTISDNHRRMREANIPRAAQQTSLAKEGWLALRAIIDGREFRKEIGDVCYVLHGDGRRNKERSALACATMAKELALTGNMVYYTTLAGLIRELDKLDYGAGEAPLNAVLSHHRNGYIVIPDFDNFDAVPSVQSFMNALDFLTSHVNSGQGLVLGQWATTPDLLETYGTAFSLVYRDFTVLDVQ